MLERLKEIKYKKIDHIAIAVKDLETAVQFYANILGFQITERRITNGKCSGMTSAVVESTGVKIVLLEGLGKSSQVSRFIEEYGPGVQHVALEVDRLDMSVEYLSNKGLEFTTSKIAGPGMNQIFSKRDENSGMMIELIERNNTHNFDDHSVQNLFEQMEAADAI